MPLQAGPSNGDGGRALKRTASKAVLNPPSSPATSRLLTTPKKRPYTGPVVDPNPINPFSTSPLRSSALKDRSSTSASTMSSPFVHASSPSKLKQLLEENSLRKIQSRISPPKEVTPRTKARKRLTGELDETPMKARVRRKRGEGRGKSEAHEDKSEESQDRDDADPADIDEEVDDFGPTPVKQAGFHPFFDAENPTRTSDAPALQRSDSLMSRLMTAGRKGTVQNVEPEIKKPTLAVPATPPPEEPTPFIAESPSRLSDVGLPSVDTAESLPEASTSSRTPSRSRREKVLSISDDEADEWDPEAGRTQHRVKIVPTRTRPHRKDWSDDHLSLDDADYRHNTTQSDSDGLDGDDDGLPGLDDTTTSQTNPSVPSPPPSMMSLLSLTSPNHRQGRYARLKELRYKALFNPKGSDAQKLRAFQKGQEAFVSGETEADDEEADLHALDQDEEGVEHADDDWESESDGWKRTGVEMDDDAW